MPLIIENDVKVEREIFTKLPWKNRKSSTSQLADRFEERAKRRISRWTISRMLREKTIKSCCSQKASTHVEKPHCLTEMVSQQVFLVKAEVGQSAFLQMKPHRSW